MEAVLGSVAIALILPLFLCSGFRSVVAWTHKEEPHWGRSYLVLAAGIGILLVGIAGSAALLEGLDASDGVRGGIGLVLLLCAMLVIAGGADWSVEEPISKRAILRALWFPFAVFVVSALFLGWILLQLAMAFLGGVAEGIEDSGSGGSGCDSGGHTYQPQQQGYQPPSTQPSYGPSSPSSAPSFESERYGRDYGPGPGSSNAPNNYS